MESKTESAHFYSRAFRFATHYPVRFLLYPRFSSFVPLGVGFSCPVPRLREGFPKGRDRSPAALCHEGVWGTGGVPHVSGGGLRGRGLYAKGPFPLPYHGNVPLREQETMRKRAASPRAFLLSEIMTAARRNSKLFVKGNDRFDLMKADFIT